MTIYDGNVGRGGPGISSQHYRSPGEIDQPLYSRITYDPTKVPGNLELTFFDFSVGRINAERDQITWLKTNMDGAAHLQGGVMHKISGLYFYFHPTSQALLNHFVKHAYFIFRICDQDFRHQPFLTMTRYYQFFGQDIKVPITILPYENFRLTISLAKPWKKSFDIIAELKGWRRRPE